MDIMSDGEDYYIRQVLSKKLEYFTNHTSTSWFSRSDYVYKRGINQ